MSQNKALYLVENALAQIYVGRRFVLQGAQFSPLMAMSTKGLLPAFVAKAWWRFCLIHPRGLPVKRCRECGAHAPPSTKKDCPLTCPMRMGDQSVYFPFRFDVDSEATLGIRVDMESSPSATTLAMFFLLDVAQEQLQASPDPLNISCDGLVQQLPDLIQLIDGATIERSAELGRMRAAAYRQAEPGDENDPARQFATELSTSNISRKTQAPTHEH